MIDFARLEEVRSRRPLIHCVSNIVAANDCANLALAVGASPIMAHAPREMADIAAASAAAVLNTGTPDEARFESCLLCGREAVRLGRPVVLDPVGVGASPWRLERVRGLLEGFRPSILRVNLGEAQALAGVPGQERGVDSLTEAGLDRRVRIASELAARFQTVVLLSGEEDVVAGGASCWRVGGGSGWMTRVTGAGCMLSVLCGVFGAVEPEPLSAAVLAAAFWKVCAQRAEGAAGERGPGSFRIALLDAAGTVTPEQFSQGAQAEICRIEL